jgi:nitrate/nitrite-specific signal transduction histidine kinase
LQKKKEVGKLWIDLAYHKNEIQCTIEDNGGGMDRKTIVSDCKSSGILIMKERLTLIHALLKTTFQFNIEDVKDEKQFVVGTRVQFNMPYILDF